MESIVKLIVEGYAGYASYLWNEILHPSWHNYFYWLIGISLFFFALEVVRPWRVNQATFRKDFWLDAFYLFFNFFLFSLIIYNAASNVVVHLFNQGLAAFGIMNLLAFEVMTWPVWAHLLVGFVVRDFVQWWIHRLLHSHPRLWEFHKVHHSVEQMGFAAHLRYHWMENVVYRTIEYLPLALIGIGLRDFFIIHIFTLAVGHFNHSNFKLNLGPLKYIFNNPQMHIWHHAYDIPESRKFGVNFGITLSIWDFLFRTNYIPHDGKDIQLGFPGMETFPKDFIHQNMHGFSRPKPVRRMKPVSFMLLILLLAGACSPSEAQQPTKISGAELVALMKNPNVQLVDVRTPREVAGGVIEGAVVIDITSPDFVSHMNALDKQKPIVLYCAVGGRSASAATRLAELGFTEIYDLTGGTRMWEAEGRPLVKPEK